MRQQRYLNDASFLLEFFKEKNLKQYVKIIVLNFKERPVKEVQGRILSGTVNLNGNSSIRRTANLTAFIEEKEASYMEIGGLFSLNKKIKIEIGFENTSNYYKEYEKIWLPLGTFVIMGLSTSHNATGGSNISLQLKDKMVLLNGECGGTIPASTTFHEYETLDPETGEYIIQKPTIVRIIQELVNHFGGEALNRIIISDLDTRIKKVMKWTQSTPLYKNQINGVDGSQITFSCDSSLLSSLEGITTVYEQGDDVGYVFSDFYYPTDLIGDAGSNVCEILDKIKNTLGNFEYFYDLDGNFIFQEVKNYLNTSKATVDLNFIQQDKNEEERRNQYLVNRKGSGKALYSFGSDVVISYSNNPQYNMIKNDFIVWGARETVSGDKIPIRYHLAIDEKPRIGNTYKCFKQIITEDYTDFETIVYKIPIEYNKGLDFPSTGEIDRLYLDLSTNKVYYWDAYNIRKIETLDVPYITRAEITTDEEGKPKEVKRYYTYYHLVEGEYQEIKTTDWRTELFLSGVMGSRLGIENNYYYTELANEWTKLYDVEKGQFYEDVIKHPSELDYYLDFIDSSAAISEFNISNIGRRTKVVSDDSINCVFEPNIPDIVLIENTRDLNMNFLVQECKDKGQTYVQVDEDIYNGLAMGGSLNSAYNKIKDLLYQHTNYNETISVQMIPMYFLEPNTRISLYDAESGIHGDYMINTISYPLAMNGTMTISGSRALERI